MCSLKSQETINRILISTTSRLVGKYESENMLISHAWPDSVSSTYLNLGESPLSRNFLVVSFTTPPLNLQSIVLPNYRPTGDVVCIYLSILFGKRFDNHGFLETLGSFWVPNTNGILLNGYAQFPPYNHRPRNDLNIELNLAQTGRIHDLFFEDSLDQQFVSRLRSAGNFYLSALQSFEQQPEKAFLDLVTCGEILSSHFLFDADQLLDDDVIAILQQIQKDLPDGDRVSRIVRSRLMQIRRRYTLAVASLLNDSFFLTTETSVAAAALAKPDIEARIKASYDLRSRYVHTGQMFGEWLRTGHLEIQMGRPVNVDRELGKLIQKSPTFWGMERIMRYCLLRFIQKFGGLSIDARLNDE